VGRTPARCLGDTLAKLGDTPTPPTGIHIPRWVGTTRKSNRQIHVFCYASERDAVHPVNPRDGNLSTNRMKQEQAGLLKKVTLPTLELIVAFVGPCLLNYVCKETGYDVTEATLWSDSTVAFGWIRNDPNRWNTFVGNHVTEIQTYTTPSQWKYCLGEENRAHYLSRGVNAKQLKELKHGGRCSVAVTRATSLATSTITNTATIAS
jgi:hypothetical protein